MTGPQIVCFLLYTDLAFVPFVIYIAIRLRHWHALAVFIFAGFALAYLLFFDPTVLGKS